MSSSTSSSSPIGAARDATPVEPWATRGFWLRAVAWPVAVALLLELACRVISPVFLQNPDPREIEVLAPGYRALRPNATIDINVGGKPLQAHINADGFRDAPLQPQDGCLVVGMGNSFVANWAVDQPEFWTTRLQARLATGQSPRRCAVRSAGVHGWSLGEIDAALADRVLARHPQVVVLAFNNQTMWLETPIDPTATDRAVAQWHAQPPATPQAVPQPVPSLMARVIGLYNVVEGHSALLGSLKKYFPMVPLTMGLTQLAVPPVYRRAAFAARQEPTIRALDAIRSRVEASGARLLVMVVPSLMELDPDVYDLMLASFGGSERDIDMRRPAVALAQWARDRGVPLVDLVPAFRGHVPDPMGYVDYHWNETGNAIAAELVEPHVRALLGGR